MSNGNVVSWAEFGKQSSKVTVTETTFNKALGSSFLPGEHQDVLIAGIEPQKARTGDLFIKLQLENNAGAKMISNVFPFTKNQETGEMEIGYKFKQLIASLTPNNPALALEFYSATTKTPETMAALVGLKTSFQADLDKKGYKITKLGDNSYQIQDGVTGLQWTGTNDSYESLAEARDHAKELNIYPQRAEVTRFLKCTADAEKGNSEAIVKVVNSISGTAGSQNQTPASSSSVRRSAM
jgi:hypothetical protein